MGSIHAFSVFLTPLEIRFGASRSSISLTYSFALLAVTATVLAGPAVYGRVRALWIFTCAGVVGIIGAGVAVLATHLPVVWLGYSLIFGAANGLAYGYGLQISAQAWPGREGLAMGIVTAAYALGAVLAPRVFEFALGDGGFGAAMLFLIAGLLVCTIFSASITWPCQIRLSSNQTSRSTSFPSAIQISLLWLAYFGGVLAGLMVIGHAAAIALEARPNSQGWIAPAVIAICNMVGCLLTGRLMDSMRAQSLLAGLAIVSAGTLGLMASGAPMIGVLACLGIIGFCYGGTISAYPAAISKQFGAEAGPRVFGRVFTAWGAAGLAGPWIAGFMFDASGSYRIAIISAACAAMLSVLALAGFYRTNAR